MLKVASVVSVRIVSTDNTKIFLWTKFEHGPKTFHNVLACLITIHQDMHQGIFSVAHLKLVIAVSQINQ